MRDEIRIVIADDHPIFRRGLRVVVEADPRLNVVDEAEDGEEALRLIRALLPDVAVLDVQMPAPDGLAVARAIREEGLPVAAVFLTMNQNEDLVNAAIEAGVRGFVLKEGAATEIVGCIKAVAEGRRFFSPLLAEVLLGRRGGEEAKERPASPLESLTSSERRVLGLIVRSKSNKEIAEELCISVRTVEHHRANICTKLKLSGKHALLTFGLMHKAELE